MQAAQESDTVRITNYIEANEIGLSRSFRQAKDDDLEMVPIKHGTIPVLHGDEHRERRMVENLMFRKSTLRRLECDILDQAIGDQLAELRLGQRGDEPARGDLLRVAKRSLLPLTASFLGLASADTPDKLTKLSDYAAIFATAGALQFKIGPVGTEREASLRAADEFRTDFFAEPWEQRKRLVQRFRDDALGSDALPEDLMTMLLIHLPDLPEDVACREAIHFIIASTDTSIMAVASSVHHLDSWLAGRSAHEKDELVRDPGFMESVVFESIRLHSPPVLVRAATEPVTLTTGRSFRDGQRVIIDIPAVNRDKEVFGSDADEFNPERHIPKKVKLYGLGFGAGSYACIGRPMATAHQPATKDTTIDDTVGTTLRMLMRFYEAGVRLDPVNPPVMRKGWIQERYEKFPILFG